MDSICLNCKIENFVICDKCVQNDHNDTRLTCKPTPPEKPDSRFNYDALIKEHPRSNGLDKIKLLEDFSADDQVEIQKYANIHSITIVEAIKYQTHCHNCGKESVDGLISSCSHQYCSLRCQEYCETFCYPCIYKDKCFVCTNWKDKFML